MDKHMAELTEDFILERVNHHAANESAEANGAFVAFRKAAAELCETLTDEQKKRFTAAENAYRLADGESQRYYYKAGFSDAVSLLFGTLGKP